MNVTERTCPKNIAARSCSPFSQPSLRKRLVDQQHFVYERGNASRPVVRESKSIVNFNSI
ncbi:hypothetical protein PUN28_003033 [Cardiocondyla obscurior]|uniref:Uncharacterized protein n=1 Tax=Cardiocondyla obscurior TaxID=286306 RepID=A0AAW2GX51_9HYME